MVVQGTRGSVVGEGDARRPMAGPTRCRLSYDCPPRCRLPYDCPTMLLGAGVCLTRRSPVADMACARSGPRGFCAAMSG